MQLFVVTVSKPVNSKWSPNFIKKWKILSATDQSSKSNILLYWSAIMFISLCIHYCNFKHIQFCMQKWKMSMAKDCKSFFMLPTSEILSTFWLSVKILTNLFLNKSTHPFKVISTAFNSLHVELWYNFIICPHLMDDIIWKLYSIASSDIRTCVSENDPLWDSLNRCYNTIW